MARRSRTTRTVTHGAVFDGLSRWARAGVEVLPEGTRWEDAFTAAGLDYTVALAPVDFTTPDGQVRRMPGKAALYREDTLAGLSVVGSRYTPSQNRDTVLRLGVGFEAQGARGVSLAELNGGRAVWGLMALGDGITIPGDDSIVSGHLLIASSHDGTVPTTVRGLAFRFDCANAFDLAVVSGVCHFRAKHTLTAPTRVDEFAATVEAVGEDFRAFCSVATMLANTPFDEAMWRELVTTVAPLPTDGDGKVREGKVTARQQDKQDALLALRGRDTVSDEMAGTAWGALNALTESLDYLYGVTVATDKRNLGSEAAFARTLWGGNNAAKANALRTVARIAGVSLTA